MRPRAVVLVLALLLMLGGCESGLSRSERRLAELQARREAPVVDNDACQMHVRRVNDELAEARRKFEAGEFPGGVIAHVDAATGAAEQAEIYCGDPP